MSKLNISNAGAALLLAWLGAGCASSQNGASTAPDSGRQADGASTTDGASKTDDEATTDDASSMNGPDSTDIGSRPDASNASDASDVVDGAPAASPLAVNLRTAGNYAILAMTKISNVPTSAITGDLGISPNAAASITGFPLTADSTNVFSTSPQVTGQVFASDYASPTPLNLTTAVDDMRTAFTDAAGRAPDVTELGAGSIGGLTIPRGVYKWSTGLLIPTDITLAGSDTDVWIFQIAQDLTVSNGTKVMLSGGALAKNVFWQVAGMADIGTTASFEGALLTYTSIALQTGASVNGRLLAQAAVTLEGNVLVAPGP